MAKTKPKHRPGIHLFKSQNWKPVKKKNGAYEGKPEWYWHVVSSNGRIIARSSETYTRKGNAVKSIRIVANVFYMQFQDNGTPAYYDHSQPDSPLKSYL
jgi:uncharacterized protein YegP (UPF0339 family)